MHDESCCGDVVSASSRLDGLGADEDGGEADVDVEVVLVPAGQRSVVVKRDPPTSLLTGGETVVHDQEALLWSDHVYLHTRVCVRSDF